MLKKIKGKLYALFFWQSNIGEYFNIIYDLRIFLKNSFTVNGLNNKGNYEAFLTKQYHIIEKGLSLPNPRKSFGIEKIKVLIEKTNNYIIKYGENNLTKSIKDTLIIYLDRNSSLKSDNSIFYSLVNNFVGENKLYTDYLGGVKKITKNNIFKAIDLDIESFFKTRTSVRNFAIDEVWDNEVIKAVEIAKSTPSVCNRQSWRVHYFKDKEVKNQLLKIQNGSNGFVESINKLIIVTTDTRRFTKLERNQVFIDGGMFAMSLVLGLHAQGIASCCLNTCLPYVDENKIKHIGKIPKFERLIMMVGVGKYKDSFEVAVSNRLDVKDIITINN